MKQGHFAIALVVALVLLCLAVASVIAKASPLLTLHSMKVSQLGDSVIVGFEVSNHTSHPYGIIPSQLEVRDGTKWRPCPDGICGFSQSDGVRAYSAARTGCVVKRLPGARLRLRMQGQRARQGLDSLCLRAKLWLEGNRAVSLSPLDKMVIVCPEAVLTSEEFTEP